jgi:hypothetical protein
MTPDGSGTFPRQGRKMEASALVGQALASGVSDVRCRHNAPTLRRRRGTVPSSMGDRARTRPDAQAIGSRRAQLTRRDLLLRKCFRLIHAQLSGVDLASG